MANSLELGSQLKEFVDDLVATGRYNSRSEVIRDGLRLLQEQERLRQIKLEEVRRAFRDGIKSGRGRGAKKVFDRLEKKYSKMGSKNNK